MLLVRTVWAMCILTIFLCGCSQLPPEAIQLLESAKRCYDAQRYDQAVANLDKFLAIYGTGQPAAEARYIRGLSLVKKGQLRRGRADLERTLAASKCPELMAKAHVAVGSLDWADGRTDAAVEHYRQALDGLEDRPPKDVVLYRLGTELQRQGQWAQARRHFAEIIDRYQHSKVNKAARLRFSWTYKFFTIQAGAFKDRRRAQQQVKKLRRVGLAAEQRLDARSGRPLYVVQVGQYDTFAKARAELPRVRRAAGEAIIVP